MPSIQEARDRGLPLIPEEKIDAYEEKRAEMQELFQDWAQDYIDGELDEDEFESNMQEALKEYYIWLALLARGELTPENIDEISYSLALEYAFLAGFMDDLHDDISDRYVIWRAGVYSFAWDRFNRFTIPDELARELPAMPGIDCLGGGACGCQWSWERVGNEIHAYWLMDPAKEHCALCLEASISFNPYIVSF